MKPATSAWEILRADRTPVALPESGSPAASHEDSLALEGLESRLLMAVSMGVDGWTQITPSTDTRTVYVSSSSGNDANSGLSPDAPVRSLARGISLMRGGSPDWMLLKRGDTWNENLGEWSRSGRSASEPMVIGNYGDTNAARPLLKTGTSNGISFGKTAVHDLAIMGLQFYAHTRDPNGGEFVSSAAGTANNGVRMLAATRNVLIEDSSFRSYGVNLVVQGYFGPIYDFKLRRSQVLDAYSTTGHSQGIYMDQAHNSLFEENLFDHNGWNEKVSGAQATIYNHNLYLQYDTSGNVVRGNIITRGSASGLMTRTGGIVENNLFAQNPLSIVFGSTGVHAANGGVTGRVANNVVLEGNDINGSARGYGISVLNVNTGGATVTGNIVARDLSSGTGGSALNIDASSGDPIRNVVIDGNIVYGWTGGLNISGNSSTVSGITVRNNTIQGNSSTTNSNDVVSTPSGASVTFANNDYYSQRSASSWFRYGGSSMSFANWVSATGDSGSEARQASFSDPNRSLGTYAGTQGRTATIDGFMSQARQQSKGHWSSAYTTKTVADYVRAGFNLGTTPNPNPNPTDTIAPGATAVLPPTITVAGATTQNFTVTFTDNIAVRIATLDGNDIRVTGPNGFSQLAQLVSVSVNTDGTPRTATYRMTAPGGAFDSADNGTYTLTLQAGQVSDTSGNTAAAKTLGTFAVNVATTPTVDTTAPTATAGSLANITVDGGTEQTFTVTFADNVAVKVSSLDGQDVRVTGPNGYSQLATLVSVNSNTDGTPRTATYKVSCPGQIWDYSDNGTYTVSLVGGQVSDTRGNTAAARTLGTFTVNIPAPHPAAIPTATLNPVAPVTGGTGTTFTVTYNDNYTIRVSSIDGSDIRVTGPNGFSQMARLVSVDNNTDGKPRVATYHIDAPGGAWSTAHNGAYTVSMQGKQVSDLRDNFVVAGALGTFAVNVATAPQGSTTPTAKLSPVSGITTAGGATKTFTVTYTDDKAIRTGTVNSWDICVTGPNRYVQYAQLVSVDSRSDGATRTATYRITAPGGSWNAADNGTYTISMRAKQVSDTAGNWVAAGALGTFAVNIPTGAVAAAPAAFQPAPRFDALRQAWV